VPGQTQEFSFAFKDIFPYISNVELEIDFGDGEVKQLYYANENGTLSGEITHTFGKKCGSTVTCSLYDVSQGGRELVSRLVIPLTKGDAATLSVSPNPAEPGSAVNLSTNIDEAGYSYQWDFGDGASDTTNSETHVSHVYENPGTYTASVTVLDAKGNHYGMAQESVTVQAPETTVEESDHSQLYGTWQSTSNMLYSVTTNQTWYWVETLQLNSDGTFHYEFAPVVTDVPEGEQPEYDSIANSIYEYEAGGGTLRIFNEGESPSDAYGYLFFDDGINDGNLYLVDETLIFNSSIFTKIG
jgi:PKD repeat protein